MPVPHDLKLYKGCADWFGTHLVSGLVRVVSHPLEVLRAYDNGVENVIAPLKPINWSVLTSLAELAKEKELTIEL